MFDVICAGQAVIDCITRGKEAEPYRENVYRAETIRLHAGGDAVNESAALASMGLKAALVCGLGRDTAGDIIAGLAEKNGVCTERIRRMDIDTPIANLQVARDGSRISVNSGATRLSGYRIMPEDLAGARVVSFASLFRPPLADVSVLKELISFAKKSGAVVCADTKLPLYEPIRLEELAEVLPLIDYIFPNEKEAAYYSGRDTLPEMARALRAAGLRNVIIKAGPEGCYVSGEEGEFSLPAEKVENVVDTTGAGDNFVAGFISGILEGASLRGCAARGIRRAALAITHTGGAGE